MKVLMRLLGQLLSLPTRFLLSKVERQNAGKELQIRHRYDQLRQRWLECGLDSQTKEFDGIFEKSINTVKVGRFEKSDKTYKIAGLRHQIALWNENAECARDQGRYDLVEEAMAYKNKFESELNELL